MKRADTSRLNAAIEAYGEQMIAWQLAADAYRPTEEVTAFGKTAGRQRRAIIERVRKLTNKAYEEGVHDKGF